jgi:hypothetical protein
VATAANVSPVATRIADFFAQPSHSRIDRGAIRRRRAGARKDIGAECPGIAGAAHRRGIGARTIPNGANESANRFECCDLEAELACIRVFACVRSS